MAMEVKLIVTATCTHRTGTSAKGNSYTMAEAFIVLDGVDFPQKFSYYCAKEQEVLSPGEYLCALNGEIVDGRPRFQIDPRQARRAPSAASVAAKQA